jgi:hypothetical protein
LRKPTEKIIIIIIINNNNNEKNQLDTQIGHSSIGEKVDWSKVVYVCTYDPCCMDSEKDCRVCSDYKLQKVATAQLMT